MGTTPLARRSFYDRFRKWSVSPAFLAWEVPAGVRGVVAGSTICGLLALATITVYATGGTHLAYAHIAYVPIIVGAFFFGFRGGILTALAIGLLLGPFMPLNVEAGTYQSSINWLSRTGFFLLTGGLAGLLCAALRTQLELARRHAYYDRLTGLPNRLSCLRDLEAMIRSADLDKSQFSVIKLGLARLDYFAATLGHRHADDLLKAAAERLSQKTDTSRSLYHVGGGVFVVVCRHTSTEEAIEFGEALLAALNERFTVGGLPILASGQFGLACYPDHAEDGEGLLRAAAAGFRDTVEKGRSYSVYDEQQNTAHRSAIMLLPDLQAAIDGEDQITLHYQPKLDMSTGACTGVEALIRWRHPERGLVPPSEFIPLAEQTALIGPLTDLVLRTAIRQASAWKEQGRPLSIAVNVSIRNLEDGSFPLKIASLLATYGVHPSALEIEVTETGLMSAQNKVIDALQSLRQLGVKVALDDFGVGQSSLAYLRNLPADVLKLDRSFIHDVSRDTKDQTIVQAIIAAAHKLEFEVVAEGIEDEPTYERLRSFACDFGQGYFIARPLSSTDFDGWLAARFQSGQYVWH